jgi:hypothetical protein
VRRADNLVTMRCRLSENPGSLNLLEPWGLIEACTGIVFILCIITYYQESLMAILFERLLRCYKCPHLSLFAREKLVHKKRQYMSYGKVYKLCLTANT